MVAPSCRLERKVGGVLGEKRAGSWPTRSQEPARMLLELPRML